MIGLYSVEQVVAAEHAHHVELAAGVLMQRAATALAVAVARLVREVRGTTGGARVVVLAGSGNNGGDALFAGARLASQGMQVLALGDHVHQAGLEALLRAGGRFANWSGAEASVAIDAADVVIDGIVGIGAKGALRGRAAELVPQVNACGALVVAVDLPSGIDADTGQVPGVAVRADLTVTFGAVKSGLALSPAAAHVGALRVVDLGIADALVEPVAAQLESADVAAFVPEPAYDDHKYRRGVVALGTGSRSYPGAALLSTTGALAGDVGMVRYVDRGLGPMVVAAHPQVVLADAAAPGRTDAWTVGCGLVGDDDDAEFVRLALSSDLPVVLDAGALSVLAGRADVRVLVGGRAAPTVLTPHEGEFARLGGDVDSSGRLAGARALAARLGAVIVLKGPASVVASPSGAAFVDAAGTSALATAGSGDVLAGLVGALLAGRQARVGGIDADEAAEVAAAACWLHGTAGRRAARGGVSVTAVDIGRELPHAVAAVRRGRMSG